LCGDSSTTALVEVDGDVFDRCTIFADKASAEITQARSVNHCTAKDVAALVEREASGHRIVDDHVPITEDVYNFFSIEPPHGRRIGADGEANVFDLTRAVDYSNGPEDNSVRGLIKAVCEAEDFGVECGGIKSMPRKLLPGHRHLVAIMRNHGELVRKILSVERCPDIAISQNIIATVRLYDGLKQQPPL